MVEVAVKLNSLHSWIQSYTVIHFFLHYVLSISRILNKSHIFQDHSTNCYLDWITTSLIDCYCFPYTKFSPSWDLYANAIFIWLEYFYEYLFFQKENMDAILSKCLHVEKFLAITNEQNLVGCGNTELPPLFLKNQQILLH